MPGGRRVIYIGTDAYDIPEEQLEAFVQQLDRDKVPFSTDPPGFDPVAADAAAATPEAPRMQHGASGSWEEEPSLMDRFIGRVKQYPAEFAQAGEGFVRGLNQSLYQGGADEVAAAARAAGGEDFGAALAGEQAARDRAWDQTPLTYGAGRALGYLPGMFLGGPAGAGLKAAAGRVGVNTAQAAVNGFLSDDGDLESRAMAAGRDALISAPFSAAGEVLTAAAPGVDRAGIALRRANAGGSSGELNAERLNRGLEHMQSGIDQDFADLGLANSWKPQSAYGVAKKLGAPTKEGTPPGMIRDAGRQMGDAIDAAGEAGVRGDWDSVRQSMDNAKRAAMHGNPEPTVSQRGFLGEMDRIAEQELPAHKPMPFDDVALDEPTPAVRQWSDQPGYVTHDYVPSLADMGAPPFTPAQKQRIRGGGYDYVPPLDDMAAPLPSPAAKQPIYNPGGFEHDYVPPTREMATPRDGWDLLEPDPNYNPNAATPRELQTKKNAFEAEGYPREGTVRLESESPRADAYRSAAAAVRNELNDAMQSQSFNDYYPAFKAGRETIEKAEPIAAMAGARAAANKAGSSVFNPLTLTMMGAGAAPGALTGNPLMALAGGVAAYGANAIGRNYGQDMAGMLARGAAYGMRGTGQGMQALGRASGAVSGTMESGEPDRDMVARFTGTQQPDMQQSIDSGRGYKLTEVVQDALRNDPQVLGPYAQSFAQAAGSGEPSAISTLIQRLKATDPDFVPVLNALRARTGGSNE